VQTVAPTCDVPPDTLESKVLTAIANLERHGVARPRSTKTLSNTLANLFKKQLTDQEIQRLIEALQQRAILSIDGTRVSYRSSSSG